MRDVVELRQRAAIAGRLALSLRKNRAAQSATERGNGRDGRRRDAGRRFRALDCVAEELLAAAFVIMERAQIERHHEQVLRFEAQTDSLRVLHAADEKPRANQRDHRQSDFGNHEDAAQRIAPPANRVSAPAHFERFDEIGTRSLDRRRNPEKQAGDDGNPERKEQHARIKSEVDAALLDEGRPERP